MYKLPGSNGLMESSKQASLERYFYFPFQWGDECSYRILF